MCCGDKGKTDGLVLIWMTGAVAWLEFFFHSGEVRFGCGDDGHAVCLITIKRSPT